MFAFRLLALISALCRVKSVSININTKSVLREVDSHFLSVAIDTGIVRRHWEQFDPSSSKVHTLASALSPCYLRVGGTEADFLIFSNDDTSSDTSTSNEGQTPLKYMKYSQSQEALNSSNDKTSRDAIQTLMGFDLENQRTENQRFRRDIGLPLEKKDLTNFTMSAETYDQIHKFVSAMGWDLIFDLNVLLRKGGNWDPTNAFQLMNYTVAKGYKMAGWELGNEPNALYHLIKVRIEADTLSKDFSIMKQKLRDFRLLRNGVILGPSVTQLNKKRTDKYFESFLKSGGSDIVTAASFHHYYINGREATVDQFYDPEVLNGLLPQVATGVQITQDSGSKAQVWLGETSSAWGGGAEGISDRYVAGFMWLDKLGIAARDGIGVVIRQSFYGGNYALLDSQTLDPNPDYWLSLLYKTLVGTKVLNVTSPDSRGKLRVYSHCTAVNKSGYAPGSVTVFALNLDEAGVDVTFPTLQSTSKLHVYNMQPSDGSLESQSVLLNGKLLELQDNKLPSLLIPVTVSQNVTVPAMSYSFIVLPNEDLHICK